MPLAELAWTIVAQNDLGVGRLEFIKDNTQLKRNFDDPLMDIN